MHHTSASSSSIAATSFVPALVVFLVTAAAVIAIIVFARTRRRRAGTPHRIYASNRLSNSGAPVRVPLDELGTTANRWLVRIDDEITASSEELGFAVAQFGEEKTQSFSRVLANARRDVSEAFTLKQRLDDARPDTEQEQRDWNERIIALCRNAHESLAAQGEAFDELRQIERNAPEKLASVRATIAAVEARIPEAEGALARLHSEFSERALATVSTNLEHARSSLAAAHVACETAETRMSSASASAASAVGVAEEAARRASMLLDAIEAKGRDLRTASAALIDLVVDSESDLREARALDRVAIGRGGADEITGAITRLETALREPHASGPKADPVTSLDSLRAANQLLESAMVSARTQQQRISHARGALTGSLVSARSHLQAAGDFIATRRGAVGPEARTRLAEAERYLHMAETEGDPVYALDIARRAAMLAQDADALARFDAENRSSTSYDGRDERYGNRGGGVGTAGALIGGLLLGGLASRGWGGGDIDLDDLFD